MATDLYYDEKENLKYLEVNGSKNIYSLVCRNKIHFRLQKYWLMEKSNK